MKDYIKLLKFLKPQLWLFVFAFIVTGISAAMNGVTIFSILPFIDIVFTGKKIILPHNVPPLLESFISYLNTIDRQVLFNIMTISIVPFFLLKGLFFWLQGYLMNMIAYRTTRDVRNKLFAKLQELSLDFYARKRTGELISRITNDVNIINHSISFALKDLIYESLRLVIYLFFAFSLGGEMALVTVLFLPLIVFPVVRIGRRLKKISRQTQEKVADITSLLSETIAGVRVVKAFSMEEYELERFKKHNNKYFKYMLKSTKRTLLSAPLSEIAGAIATTIIFFIWIDQIISGKISFGGFGVVMGSLMSIMQPLKRLTAVHFTIQKGTAAGKRIYEILDEEVSVKDNVDAIEIKSFERTIKFDGVWFKYAPDSDFILKDINMEIKKGEIVAIVGASGSGKTTLVNLIPRFYDVSRGRILIDGIDIRKIKILSLRKLISLVTQETVLFNDTVRANISYGNLSRSQREIEDSARKALAHDFIMNLPQGYDTIIGDKGFRLSGGEKQRIAIARAILKDAPILILDEATSNLDSVSEQLVKKAIYNLLKDKTAFIVAHRLSTIYGADRIIVIDKGVIVEEGTHQELLKKSGVYRNLYDLQFGR